MKKIIFILLLSLIFVFSTNAQTNDTPEQTKALKEIGELNGQVVALFKKQSYDDALKTALNIQNLAEKNGLAKDVRVLPALSNLAEVYLVKGKETEALATFQKVLETYQSSSGDTALPIVKTMERIAVVHFVKKDYGKAEEFFLKALPLQEKLSGAESKEMVYINNALGDIYRKKNNYTKAGEFYLKAIAINDKILSKEEKENREDLSNYECFLYHKAYAENNLKNVSRQIKEFNDGRKTDEEKNKSVESGVVNGKAINLVKPAYPTNMRGTDGFVLVRVTIDEQGNVISAKATCGILGFVEAVEEAARKSKFTPTLISGQPVKVTGVIVYNFIR